MKKINSIFTFLLLNLNLFAQQNDFKIGMFGFGVKTNPSTQLPYTTVKDTNNYNTSSGNVLSNDGFNVIMNYQPDYVWYGTGNGHNALKSYLTLINANSLKVQLCLRGFYKPNLGTHSICEDTNPYNGTYIFPPTGTNVYNFNGDARPNWDDLYNSVFNVAPYSSIIWGHQITIVR